MKRRLFLAAALATACSRKREPLQVFNTIPEFTLTDQNGDDFTYAAKLKGHVWVADFIFTTCTGPCPRLTTQMSRVHLDVPAFQIPIDGRGDGSDVGGLDFAHDRDFAFRVHRLRYWCRGLLDRWSLLLAKAIEGSGGDSEQDDGGGEEEPLAFHGYVTRVSASGVETGECFRTGRGAYLSVLQHESRAL